MTPPDHEKAFRAFMAQAVDRLRQGQAEYHDVSFGRPLLELIDEIDQELLDVAGWSFIMATRLRQVRELVKALPDASLADVDRLGRMLECQDRGQVVRHALNAAFARRGVTPKHRRRNR